MLPLAIIVSLLVLVILAAGFKIVPQNKAFVVERLGKFDRVLDAGPHVLIPVLDRVAYSHTLKEQVIDVLPQQCITKDNIAVDVDGVLYMRVMDPARASYGVSDYLAASINLAQTTIRSEIGKLELDRTFEERSAINTAVCDVLDKASDPWGIKVTRYEIKSITPPQSIRDAMEKQMRAEREKRAMVAESEGEKQSVINRAEGDRQQAIERSEGEKQRRINEAEGRAREIALVAEATAQGIRSIAQAIINPGGEQAVNLRLAEQYIGEFGKLAKTNNTIILPANVADIAGIVKIAATVASSKPAP